MIDRSQTKNEIRDQIAQLAADTGNPLSRSRADTLANRFKRGEYDGTLAYLMNYADPVGEKATARVLAAA